MSIFKIIETKRIESSKLFTEYLTDLKGDTLEGASFMFYSLNVLFNEFSIEEIEHGVVDSSYREESHDYGIDAIYVTGNKELIQSAEELDSYTDETKFCIHILQFKKGRGVDQGELLKLKEGIKRLIVDEDIIEADNEYLYNFNQELMGIKNGLYDKFSSSQISIKVYIVFGGIENNILKEPLLVKQIDGITQALTDGGYNNNTFEIIGAQKLIDIQKKGNEITDVINYIKTFKYISAAEDKKLNGYICIAKALQISNLVKEYQEALFEANIRDYYKNNDLNDNIFNTASSDSESKYFWSYNNGITITCRKVEELPNDKYRLHGLQIVNGCQSSNSIYRAAVNSEKLLELQKRKDAGEALTERELLDYQNFNEHHLQEDTSVLIKIIETDNVELIYRITETTNSQTPIKAFSLKANQDIQKLIEEYLLSYDIHYERRINSYRNKGVKNVISIQKLFQLYVSQVMFRPSQARDTPKKLMKQYYDKVFPITDVKSIDYSLYLIPIKIDESVSRKIRQLQKDKAVSDAYDNALYLYGRNHLGVFLLHSILGKDYNEKGIISNQTIIQETLKKETEIDRLFLIALENFKNIMKDFAGSEKELILPSMKKTELDERIVRFVKSSS